MHPPCRRRSRQWCQPPPPPDTIARVIQAPPPRSPEPSPLSGAFAPVRRSRAAGYGARNGPARPRGSCPSGQGQQPASPARADAPAPRDSQGPAPPRRPAPPRPAHHRPSPRAAQRLPAAPDAPAPLPPTAPQPCPSAAARARQSPNPPPTAPKPSRKPASFPPRRAEPARTPRSIAQGLHHLEPRLHDRGHNTLRDAVAMMDRVGFCPKIDQSHPQRPAIIAVDRSRTVGNGNPELHRQPGSGPDLHLEASRDFHPDACRHNRPMHRVQHKAAVPIFGAQILSHKHPPPPPAPPAPRAPDTPPPPRAGGQGPPPPPPPPPPVLKRGRGGGVFPRQ